MTPLWLAIPLMLLTVAAGACAAYWSVALCRIVLGLRRLPGAGEGASLPAPEGGWPSVCVVVPCHNEEAALPALIRSLRGQQYPHLRVVLSLDRCTDDSAGAATRAIDGDPRFEILEIDACPEGWAGKTHAAWRGARTGMGDAERVLFIDADTELHRDCVRAAVALLDARRLDLLSLLSTLSHERWFERVAQPAAVLELLRQYPLERANRDEERRPFANGQFLLFRRDAYDAIGGHESVADHLLEDIALARRVHSAGRRPGVLRAGAMLRCRMYDDWASFRRGWKRIYTESANRRPQRLRGAARRAFASGAMLPSSAALALLGGAVATIAGDLRLGVPAIALGLCGCLASLGAQIVLLSAQRASIWSAPLQPLGAALVSSILREAARDLDRGVRTSWGGIDYVRATRDDDARHDDSGHWSMTQRDNPAPAALERTS